MPKQSVKAEINTFVKGLITEASPLNFPPNASVDEENFELKRDGSRARRNGMALEEGAVQVATSAFDLSTPPTTFIWSEASSIPDANFVVVQFGNTLYFFNMNSETLSADGYAGSLNLTNSDKSFTPVNIRFSFSNVDGYLIVAGGQESIAVVSYTEGTFSVEYGRLQVRDVWGIEI